MTSVAPPGGNGTIMRTGLVGKVGAERGDGACALAAPAAPRPRAASASTPARRARIAIPSATRCEIAIELRVRHPPGRPRIVAVELLEIEGAGAARLRWHAVRAEQEELPRDVAEALGVQPQPHEVAPSLELRVLGELGPGVQDHVVVQDEHVAPLEVERDPVLRRPGNLVEEIERRELEIGELNAALPVSRRDPRPLV